MSNRELARQAIAEISAHDLDATFRVEGPDKLFITGKLTSDLARLIKQHKADLIDYLTVPPDTVGICRGGHKIDWRCTRHGLWVCSCYFEEQEHTEEQEIANLKPAKKTVTQLKDYWQKAI